MSLLMPSLSVRRYSGEPTMHEHAHAQIMFALCGRMELEINGRASWSDPSCGMVIPAGTAHTFVAPSSLQMLIIDAPMQAGTEKVHRFAVQPAWRALGANADAQALLGQILQAPRVLARRELDPQLLYRSVQRAPHRNWNVAAVADLYALSPQRLRARWLELTGEGVMASVRRLRLDAAQALIAQGLWLDAVALQTGYRSASALSHALLRERSFSTRLARRRAQH